MAINGNGPATEEDPATLPTPPPIAEPKDPSPKESGTASQLEDEAIDYRGMAHCKEPNNLGVRQALHETLSLCRAAGIEWTDIEY